MTEPLRLSKRVAADLGCSRQDAELFIAGGWVRVDGVVVEQPQARVRPEQAVTLDPKARPEPIAPVTLLWHKPPGAAWPEGPQAFGAGTRFAGDRSGLRLLQAHRLHLAPVLPLELADSGLMIFTQSPGVARKLSDRQSPIEQEWFLDVAGEVADREAVLRAFGKPLFFDGAPLPPARASWQSDRRIRVVIKGAVPGQVAHLAQRAGLTLSACRRQRLGRVGLDAMAPGQWRYALPTERF